MYLIQGMLLKIADWQE